MSKRPVLILLACIAVSIIWYRSSQHPSLPLQNTRQTSKFSQKFAASHPAITLDTTDSTLSNPQQPDLPEQSSAIEDETIFTFLTEEDLNTFLAALDNAGIPVSAVSRRLRSVKLSTNPAQTATAKRLAGNHATSENNYTILTPFPILPNSEFQGQAFEENALPHLGVPANNTDWGKGTTIAILDTGILAHETLNGVSIKHLDLIHSENSEQTTYAPHGTAVASLIAGQSGNGIAPNVNLLSIRVLDSDGIGDTFTLAQGIVEAVDNGANVINMSLGGFGDSNILRSAIDYAAEKGVVLVAATGNEGQNILPYPAAYDSVISVSAIDAANQHATFANQAQGVDLAAPGVGITAAWDNEQWVSFTGTSASTPYVSGAIAAILSQTENTTAIEAAATLILNANDTGYPGLDPQTGRGVIDLQRALYTTNDKVTDLALANIHIHPTPAPNGDTKIYVTAQNRGTQSIPAANLSITVGNNFPQTAYLGQLEAGEIKTHELSIHNGQLQSLDPLSINAKAIIPYGTPDSKESNNKASTLVAPKTE